MSAKLRRHAPPAERIAFYSAPDPSSGCILWTGFINKTGYGELKIRQKHHLAHRLSWSISQGPIPDGMFVCHKCDVRRCVNPDHLFLGTADDNTQDMMRKGRQRLVGAPPVKLDAVRARTIRESTESHRVIADRFGVSRSLVYAIKRRIVWAHA